MIVSRSDYKDKQEYVLTGKKPTENDLKFSNVMSWFTNHRVTNTWKATPHICWRSPPSCPKFLILCPKKKYIYMLYNMFLNCTSMFKVPKIIKSKKMCYLAFLNVLILKEVTMLWSYAARFPEYSYAILALHARTWKTNSAKPQ